MIHRTIQWSWFPLMVGVMLGAIEAIVLVGLSNTGELTPWIAVGTTVLSAVIVLVVLAFGRQVVEVDASTVATWFGLGWPKRTFPVGDITAIRRVRNSWWYGWGIRWVPNGSMYNTWGRDAVEIGLTSGRVFRIGTPDPGGLADALSVVSGLPAEPPPT